MCVPARISFPSLNSLLDSSLLLSHALPQSLYPYPSLLSKCFPLPPVKMLSNVITLLNPSHFPFFPASLSHPFRYPVSPPFSSNPCPGIVLFMHSNICKRSATSLTKNSASLHPYTYECVLHDRCSGKYLLRINKFNCPLLSSPFTYSRVCTEYQLSKLL